LILETVQGEGGLNVASNEWLQGIERICRKHDILLIVDDIQAGCGRTGTFFSFEPAGIKPDMITLSKSLSGFGSPMAVVLIRPDLDVWAPGEHNGTFRGNNHAFITASAALRTFWQDDSFATQVQDKARRISAWIAATIANLDGSGLAAKGRGIMQGIDCVNGDNASAISRAAFANGLIIETAGNYDQVVKLFCPLTISEQEMTTGLGILTQAFTQVFAIQAQSANRQNANKARLKIAG
jgi:diaminobutyrate-2-oxoglutarate transaminase